VTTALSGRTASIVWNLVGKDGTVNPSEEQTRSAVIEKIFEHPPEKLWRALTEPALLTQWLLSNTFLPELGREFQFKNEPVGGWDGVIDARSLHLMRCDGLLTHGARSAMKARLSSR
jgi:Activator of Hsp90 ATPase homolog 1-like protein